MNVTAAPRALEHLALACIRPNPKNARTHSRKQIRQIARSIERFGFTNPILVGDDGVILAGHGRFEAAKLLGFAEVPVLRLSNLTEVERRAYVIADNRLAEKAGWDRELLAIELQCLVEVGFDVELTGFEVAEIDLALEAQDRQHHDNLSPADQVPPARPAVSRVGDLWHLGKHRLLCGSALDPRSYSAVLNGEAVELALTDPPYNVPIQGHVSGNGRVRHREFAHASGEMTAPQFTAFLQTVFGHVARHCVPGALVFAFMDWAHQREMLSAGDAAFRKLLNLVVWNKSNGGMGSFYRSKHELVFVWKVDSAPHINNVELGRHGRNRSNVWDYAGVNSFGPGRMDELERHPTVKPVALLADAIRDASRRNGIVLDPFCGSGTILVAAEQTGRRARAIEIDPVYVDVALRRWQDHTGKRAVLAGSSKTFEEVEEDREDERNIREGRVHGE